MTIVEKCVYTLFLLANFCVFGQDSNSETRPKLVVGIVVDQMRYDYLTRFWNHYSDHGFKKLIKDGFVYKNMHYNYTPTVTAAGHASIFTGTTPAYHGIIANTWYDKGQKENMYCVSDKNVEGVGTKYDAGKMSPKNLWASTFTDQNRIHTQFRSKTIGISMKDRGAILPAGHAANAAYWFVGKSEGKFVSSTFYMEALPKWVREFNGSKKVDKYLTNWEPIKSISTYIESTDDLNDYEGGFKGKKTATFPYNLKNLFNENGGYDIIPETPFGNNLLLDFAQEAIIHESLGKREVTDVLTISFSSTDKVGHNFGVQSVEIQDTYIRLDRTIEELLKFLDIQIGKKEYLVFLTADHAGTPVAGYLGNHNIKMSYFMIKDLQESLEKILQETFGKAEIIENISNNQVFLNKEYIFKEGLSLKKITKVIVSALEKYEAVNQVYTRESLLNGNSSMPMELSVKFGFNPKLSGDVAFTIRSDYSAYKKTGSSHGSSYNDDTHVPFIIYGKNISKGESYRRVHITDIAPTISSYLGISYPNNSIGNPLVEIFETNSRY